MKAYSEYKDSGIDWIGKIPKSWDIIKLKFTLSSLQSGNRESGSIQLEDGAYSIGGEHIGWDTLINLSHPRFISKEYFENLNNGIIKLNDVLLVKDGATIGKCTIFKEELDKPSAVNEHVFILRTNEKYNPDFLFYQIFSNIGQEQIKLCIRGSAQPGLNSSFVNYTYLSLPTLEDQKKIVEFLNNKTSKINDLVKNKQKLIELLKEQRLAIINHAVTKGLNDNCELVDSNIEWVGKVPKHWKISKIRFEGTLQAGISKSGDYFGEGDPFVTYKDIYDSRELKKASNLARISEDEKERFSVKKGDVFFTRTSETMDDVGKASTCLKDIPNASYTGFAIRFRPNSKKLDERFTMYYFSNIEISKYFNKYMNLVTRASLSQGILKTLHVLIPPISEQKEIVTFLNTETSQIDKSIEKIHKEIELLQEYTEALISEAVTGKIKIEEAS